MKFKELSKLSEEDIDKKLLELRKELMKQYTQVATGTTPKNPSQIKQSKRAVARLLTELHRRKGENTK